MTVQPHSDANEPVRMFSVRVELHNEQDYTQLHAAMWAEGFRRIVTYQNQLHQLPTGSYVIHTKSKIDMVMVKVRLAAAKTKKAYMVWLVEMKDFRPHDLPIVPKDPDAP